jgi:hypothetical protein
MPFVETPQITSTDKLTTKIHLIWSTDAWWYILPDIQQLFHSVLAANPHL